MLSPVVPHDENKEDDGTRFLGGASLPGSDRKTGLVINRSFSAHSTLAGEERKSNCTIRFLQHNAWLGPDDVYRTLAPTL